MYGHAGRTAVRDDLCRCVHVSLPGNGQNGPYALFESATGWDHSQSQNSQMNLKIHPKRDQGDIGTKHLADLAQSYLRRRGFHIQFNVIDNKTLHKAQEAPENYRDLMVRVAGFTQYWVEIGKPIQDEVITRTEYVRSVGLWKNVSHNDCLNCESVMDDEGTVPPRRTVCPFRW